MNISDWSKTTWPAFMATYVCNTSTFSRIGADTPAVVSLSPHQMRPFMSPQAFSCYCLFGSYIDQLAWKAAICRRHAVTPSSVRLSMIVKSDEAVGLLLWQSDTLLVAGSLMCFLPFKSFRKNKHNMSAIILQMVCIGLKWKTKRFQWV